MAAQTPTELPSRRQRRWSPSPPVFIWVPAALVAAAMLLPPVYLAVRTFGAEASVWDLLVNARTGMALVRTVTLVLAVTSLCIVLAGPVAWLTVRADLPLRRAFAVVMALPLVIPSYVFAMLVVAALGPKGMVQGWLEPLGVDRLPDIFGLPGAVLTLTLLSYPYVLLPVRAALARTDPALEEASRGLGRGALATFRRVTIPMLRPAIVTGSLLVALYTLSDFGAVSLLRYQTFTWSIYIQYDSAIDRSVAAGLSLVLVALALVIVLFESRYRGVSPGYRVTPGTASAVVKVPLGVWRWPAVGFLSSVAVTALAAPMAILLFWVVRGVSAGEPLSFLWTASRNSLYVSGLAAVAAALASLPIAILVVRFPGRAAATLERLTYIGFALPGVAVALAFVFFATGYARVVYQTTFLLVVAYLVLFLPAAAGATQTSLRQVSPRLEEAARGLGKTPLYVVRTVTLPLVWRGIAAGAALVFLLTMKELPATLILSPIGFKTLATSVWAASSEAFFARAAAPALLLILASAVPMAFLSRRE